MPFVENVAVITAPDLASHSMQAAAVEKVTAVTQPLTVEQPAALLPNRFPQHYCPHPAKADANLLASAMKTWPRPSTGVWS
jgi:hypothetical protein